MKVKTRIDHAKPRCPKCGSPEVKEWDLVPVPYVVMELARNEGGSVYVADTAEGGESQAWDCGQFDSLMCRECDYESADCAEFFPDPTIVLGEN